MPKASSSWSASPTAWRAGVLRGTSRHLERQKAGKGLMLTPPHGGEDNVDWKAAAEKKREMDEEYAPGLSGLLK